MGVCVCRKDVSQVCVWYSESAKQEVTVNNVTDLYSNGCFSLLRTVSDSSRDKRLVVALLHRPQVEPPVTEEALYQFVPSLSVCC